MSLVESLFKSGVIKIKEPKPVEVVEDPPEDVVVPDKPDVPASVPTSNTEEGRYHGRHNGDRATWYFSKKMKDYPDMITVNVEGCYDDFLITNNGTRWEGNRIIMKQSDVSGRGMALIVPSSCKSKKASIMF